ncbi:MAG: polysaccharide biosynthesis tyrosine autokinase [Bacteroidota bacterium]
MQSDSKSAIVKGKTNTDEIDLSFVIKELKKHWRYFPITLVTLLVLAFLYFKFVLPTYESTSSVLITDPSSKDPAKSIESMLSGDLLGTATSVPTEIGVLQSKTVLQGCIDELGLQVSYFNTSSYPYYPLYKKEPFFVTFDTLHTSFYNIPFEVKIIDPNHFQLSVEADDNFVSDYSFTKTLSFGQKAVTKYFAITLTRNENIPDNALATNYRFVINSSVFQISNMQAILKTEAIDKDADIISLTYDDNVPQRSVDILNAVMKVYIGLDVKDKAEVASLTLKFIDQQLDNTNKELSQVEIALQEFKEQHKTVDLSEEAKAVLGKISTVETDRVKNDIEMKSMDNLLGYISSNKDLTSMAPSSLGIPDPLLITLIQQYQEQQAKRKSLSYGMKNDAPTLRILDQQIADTKASLIENIKSIQKNMTVTDQSLNQQIGGFSGYIQKVPGTERELIAIQRKVEVNQNIYVYLLQKKAETSIAKATVVSDKKVLDAASLDNYGYPIAPNKKVIISAVLLLSLIIPSFIIFLKSVSKSTISNREEIAKLTSIPVLGVVGHLNKSDNLIVHHKPKSAIAEAFRSIRTNLQFFGSHEKKKIILITSSVGSEGKSFFSINLASVITLQNNKVVLVGLDLRKPKIYQDFNLSNQYGVSSYLIGKKSIDEILQKSKFENLDIITAGPIPPNPAELISKNEMKVLFDELALRYDYVIVDTPPLGIVSDAFLLMNHSHINIYIIRENYSKHEFIRSLNDLYEEEKLKDICIVLNDSDFRRAYGYGYGHNYGYLNDGSGYYDEDHSNLPFYKRIFKKKKAEA